MKRHVATFVIAGLTLTGAATGCANNGDQRPEQQYRNCDHQ